MERPHAVTVAVDHLNTALSGRYRLWRESPALA